MTREKSLGAVLDALKRASYVKSCGTPRWWMIMSLPHSPPWVNMINRPLDTDEWLSKLDDDQLQELLDHMEITGCC